MKSSTHLAFFALLLFGSARTCDAAFLEYLSGSNSTALDGFGRQGKMSFAVYDNPIGSDWRADLFGGQNPDSEFGAGFTGAERSVFFFQYERLDSSTAASDSFTFPDGIDPYVTAGYYSDFDMNATFTTNTDSNIPVEELATGISFTAGSAGSTVDPSFVNVAGDVSMQFLAPILTGGEKTSLLVLTSFADIQVFPRNPEDWKWSLAYASMVVDNTSIFVPVPNPEPGSLALLGFGMLGVASIRRPRRKRNVIASQV